MGTFIVQVKNTQNATWQGTVNWVEENKTQPFRSTLELIKLIDGAIEDPNEKEKGASFNDKQQK